MYFFGAKMYVLVMQYDIYLEYPGKSLGVVDGNDESFAKVF